MVAADNISEVGSGSDHRQDHSRRMSPVAIDGNRGRLLRIRLGMTITVGVGDGQPDSVTGPKAFGRREQVEHELGWCCRERTDVTRETPGPGQPEALERRSGKMPMGCAKSS